MNILSFDIEEWFLEKEYYGNRKTLYKEYYKTLDIILNLLDSYNLNATFFCLGKVAEEFSDVIQQISSRGHEIGCHSNYHKWINKMTQKEFLEDTKRAVFSLEDLIGKKVISYRAPAFSIGESNKWAFEILIQCGIENDASIFPGNRDLGGFPTFIEQEPCQIIYNNLKINEFPIPLYKIPILNKGLAFSGGGFFRLLPQLMIEKLMNQREYNMCYFHIDDLLKEKYKLKSKEEFENYYEESGTIINRYLRYFKSNVGRSSAIKKFESLMTKFDYTSIENYLGCNTINKIVKI